MRHKITNFETLRCAWAHLIYTCMHAYAVIQSPVQWVLDALMTQGRVGRA
jgi:hypothetical protein